MGSTYLEAKKSIASSMESAMHKLGYKVDGIESTIEFSKGFGDISCSIAFRLAKEQGKSAELIANEIKSVIEKPAYAEKITADKGFVNFHLDRIKFAMLLFNEPKELPKKNLGRAIIEYPSVNPNKPWHIGHLRNALLGDSVSKLYTAIGYNVQRQDYIDDLGLQMAETMWWYLREEQTHPEKKFDHWLGEEYVTVNKHLEDPGAKEGIAKTLALMDQDGTYESEMLRIVASKCVEAQYETAFDYSIYHDVLVWESDIVRAQLFEQAMVLLKKTKFVETPKDGDYANCTVINLDSIENLPPDLKGIKERMKVLIRSDGTPTYLGKDIAFHMWKLGILENNFKYSIFMEKQRNDQKLYTTSNDGTKMDMAEAQVAINVIGDKQSHPQSILKVVFGELDKMSGKDSSERIKHLAYGEVELESGALAGRKGTWMGFSADDLLREARSKTIGLIKEKFKFDKNEEEKIAESVALSAIKFEFLKFGTEKKIVFSWDRALNFEGNSGPYAQYMHARATRILEEAPKKPSGKPEGIGKVSDYEFTLAKLLSKKGEIVAKAAAELRPNVITDYINELAYAFAAFYENSPVLKADSADQMAFRLSLTRTFKEAMKMMLELLGIEALDRM